MYEDRNVYCIPAHEILVWLRHRKHIKINRYIRLKVRFINWLKGKIKK